MKLQLKLEIEKAIEKVIQKAAEDGEWPYFIHDELISQMVNAAEAVFDSAQNAQAFYEENKAEK